MVLYRQYYSGINVNDSVDFHGHPKQTFSLICVAWVCAHWVLFVFNAVEEKGVTISCGLYHDALWDESINVPLYSMAFGLHIEKFWVKLWYYWSKI